MRKLKIFAVAALLLLLPLCACGAETPEVIENDFDLPYDMYVEAERAEESLTVKKLDDVPGYIRGDIASISGIVDDNTLLMTVHNTRENYYFGTYDLESGEYTECYAVDRVDGEYCEVAAVGDGYLILYSTNSDWQYASLKYVPLDGGRAKKFFDYSFFSNTWALNVSANNICVRDGKIYFDDISVSGDALRADLYCYDIETGKTELIMEHAQNPFEYGKTIGAITRNRRGEYKVFSTISGSKIDDIDVNLMWMASNGDEIFCIENYETNDEEGYTIQRLTNLTDNKPLLSTEQTISDVKASEYFVGFTNYASNHPCVYDVKNNKMLVFESIRKGEHTCFIKDNYGIFMTYYGTSRYETPEFYFFSYGE